MARAHSGDRTNKLCSRQHCCGFNGGMSVTEYLVEDIFADLLSTAQGTDVYTGMWDPEAPLESRPSPELLALWAGS